MRENANQFAVLTQPLNFYLRASTFGSEPQPNFFDSEAALKKARIPLFIFFCEHETKFSD